MQIFAGIIDIDLNQKVKLKSMKNDGLFYGVLIGIAVMIMVGVGVAVVTMSHTTSSDVQQVKVVAIDGESISFENTTTRYNLYNSGAHYQKLVRRLICESVLIGVGVMAIILMITQIFRQINLQMTAVTRCRYTCQCLALINKDKF